MTERQDHWNRTYSEKGEAGVSWFQEVPARSFELITALAPELSNPIIDVGGGASRLVDTLLAEGYGDLTVLDVSRAAISADKARLGTRAGKVQWIEADVTEWRPGRRWRVWHDRAVFHFLTTEPEQEAYLRALRAGTSPGAIVIVATFALDGPERCSGLPVQRYSAETLAARLGSSFTLVEQAREAHQTPWGSEQRFVYAVFRKV